MQAIDAIAGQGEPSDGSELLLTVSSLTGTQISAKRIGSGGAWIGRAPACDIFIEDPDRYVSLQHCRIDFAEGSFWVTDRSTNGTFLNGAASPLPKDERRQFGAGDRLRIGRFQISAAATAVEPGTARTPATALPVEPEVSPLLDPAWALPSRPAALSGGSDTTGDTLEALLSDLIPGTAARPAAPPSDRLVEFLNSPSPPTATSGLEPAMPPDMPPVPPPASADPRPRNGTVDDVVAAIASEIVRPPEEPANGTKPQTSVYVPDRLAAATGALAAFWCGLGVMPRNLDPATLANVMAEFGAALREASDGFASLLGSSTPSERAATNPFVAGRGGLRRFLDQRDATQPRLDDAVRDVFTLAAEREDAYVDAVRAALLHALRSMTPRAVEERLGSSLRSHRQTARAAELLELMRNMEAQLIELAEAQFHKELGERMRPRVRRLLTFEKGGLHP